ncbi:MAG TPA: aldehyde dehydrogenase [Povalibacter sp.]|nr:aldehyde dehydrogenase [Povalibacter sp.]
MNTQLLIDNQDRPASGGATFERRNPLSGEVATVAAAATIADARAAADSAHAAFPQWSATGPSERRDLLLRAAEQLQRRQADFAAAMLGETGGTGPWAGFNVMLAANMLREAASLTGRASGAVVPSDRPGSIVMAVRQPAGVVLGIAPWNAPVILGVRAVATPLACGNTVVLKASEQCPHTHRLIGEGLREAGFPPGVMNVVTNAPADAAAIVDSLIAHPAIRRINFTGSTRVGRIIAEAAAHHLKPVLLELGGKAPLIVLDDADLDAAVSAAVFGAFMNQGQICMSTERIVIHESIADAFVTKLVARARALPAGDPRRGPVVLGPLIGRDAAQRFETLLDEAIGQGATAALRGAVEGTIAAASVLDRVNPRMRIYKEESFGPVACVIRVQDDAEAIAVANDTEYGLSSAIFSRNVERALNMARRIDAGMCHINGPTVHDEAQMPFGGMKASGYGRFGGDAGIAEFTDLRTITIATSPVHYPF